MKIKTLFSTLCILTISWSMNAQFKTIKGLNSQQKIEKQAVLPMKSSVQANKDQSISVKSIDFNKPQTSISVAAIDKNNKPIQFESNQKLRKTNGSTLEQASLLWEAVKSDFDMQNSSETLTAINHWTDELAETHIKVQQTYLGMPIYGAQLIFHGDESGFNKVNGDYINLKDCHKKWEVSLTQEDIKSLVRAKFPNHIDVEVDFDQLSVDQWTIETLWYSEDFSSQKMQAAAHVIYYPNIADRHEVIINLNTGKTIKSFQSVCKLHNHEAHKHTAACSHKVNTKTKVGSLVLDGPATANALDLLGQNRLINTYEVGSTYFLIDGSKSMFSLSGSTLPDEPQGAIWTIDANNTVPQSNDFQVTHIASNNNQWGQSREGVSAHYNAEQAYLYFKQTFNRESINGGGGTIVSIVNVADEDGGGLDNAFWNGAAIFYGNGKSAFKPLGRALDVAGHEMSHGVVQNTANLEYYGESGAMNESFADIFGAMIDRDDWKIGEDVVELQFFPSGALRDMENPNNGASTGDFGSGWQPDNTSQQFTGQEDNNGVHINSGIPNHAYYLFATEIGKTKAEQIFYRALTTYLTRSSQFVDLRNAVVNAAKDLHGQNSSEENAAKNAFAQVGIGEGSGTTGPTDADVNPGEDFLLFSDEQASRLFIFRPSGEEIFNPLSTTDHISKPSITDDGSTIVFIDSDKMMRRITIDWNTLETNEEVIQAQPIWRNVVISKDGSRVAAITDQLENQVSVFDFGLSAWNDFELYNPTFTEGIETGDVDYADAMEFDITGELLMYDAQSTINSLDAGEIQFWDISFLEVWNNQADTWRLGNISKLFSGLPEGVSIGNPTFSKNSPFIVAFDFIEESEISILGANIETGDIGFIQSNTGLGYPSYSLDDQTIIYDVPFIQNGDIAGYDIGFKSLQADKINGVDNTSGIFTEFVRWPVWFGNGERDLTSIEDFESSLSLDVFPNPASNQLHVNSNTMSLIGAKLEILTLDGRMVLNTSLNSDDNVVDINSLGKGSYIVKISTKEALISRRISKL